ncbi:BBS2 [Bugula neritina]|uniref:BBS2 n=1 Tax=Bugula neritina TaxID=10212 RepID=A0A7J7IXS1_BUGNE|nr:BBS2 [Bugula neritina]
MGIIPANTQLQTTIYVDPEHDYVTLKITTNNDTVIKSVLVFSEGIFEGESHVIHPKDNELSGSLEIPIQPPKDISVDLHVKAFVGNKQTNHQYHVFELTRTLPKFSMYILVSDPATITRPDSGITFTVKERIQREGFRKVLMWINQNFLLDEDINVTGNELEVMFICQRTKTPLVIKMDASNQVSILTTNMNTAGEILQSLASFLNIEHLNVQADFKHEMKELGEILTKVDEYHTVRQRLTADMADHSNLIKSMVVRAEDARLMDDLGSMKKYYMELYDLNRDLINGYKIRCNNHTELLSYLKQVNQYIQKAGKLRVGKYKTQVIADCRASVKNNNVAALFKIIKTGSV